MSIQAGKILDVLILPMRANGAPLLAKQLLGDRRSHPLEGHLRFADGRRLFDGTRCDPRGACDGSRRRPLGYRYWACRYDWSEARLGWGIFFAASSSGGSAWNGAAWLCGWIRSPNRYRPALLNASFAQRFHGPGCCGQRDNRTYTTLLGAAPAPATLAIVVSRTWPRRWCRGRASPRWPGSGRAWRSSDASARGP